MTARAELFAAKPLEFPRPRGVEMAETIAAQRETLRVAHADATSRECYITELESDRNAQANIIRDLQAELAEREAKPPLKFVETFNDLKTSYAVIAALCAGLRIAGKEPVMEWHGDGTNIWLTVSIEDDHDAE